MGSAIKKSLFEMNLTQKAGAELLGISPSRMSDLVRGRMELRHSIVDAEHIYSRRQLFVVRMLATGDDEYLHTLFLHTVYNDVTLLGERPYK